jgi:SLA1 homology domain 1, SHD1
MGLDQTSKFCPTCHKSTLWARPSTNHLLHLLVTLFLCGFWLPVWILASIKIGGWRCQTCGYRGSAVSRLVGLVVVPVVCVGFFLVVLGAIAANYGSSDRPRASTTAPIYQPPAEATVEPVSVEPVVLDEPASLDESRSDSESIPASTESESGTEPTDPVPPIDEPDGPEQIEFRIWTDSTGKHETEAKFAGMAFGKVTLEKRDGSRVTLPLEKLSADDQAWIEAKKRE